MTSPRLEALRLEHRPRHDGHGVTPPRLRQVVAVIEASPELPHTPASLASAAGMSVRSLQAAFRRYLGTSPMTYLRGVRLERIHQQLTLADPRAGVTVTDVCMRWGVFHLGRLAAAYRSRYGVSPSTTLRGTLRG